MKSQDKRKARLKRAFRLFLSLGVGLMSGAGSLAAKSSGGENPHQTSRAQKSYPKPGIFPVGTDIALG